MDVTFFRCLGCERDLGAGDIKRIKAGSGEMLTCAFCGEHVREEQSRVVKPIVGELATAMLYPFRPLPLACTLGVALFAGGCSFLPFGFLVAAGIRFGWLFAVLRAASNGKEDVEIDPTEISPSMVGWIVPAVRFAFACLVAFSPAIAAQLLLGEGGGLLVAVLGLAGVCYLPAALICASLDDGWISPLNPVPAIGLIRRIPRSYFLACGMLVVLFLFAGAAVAGARALDLPIVSFVVESLLGFLPLVAAARLLGVLVYEEREEL